MRRRAYLSAVGAGMAGGLSGCGGIGGAADPEDPGAEPPDFDDSTTESLESPFDASPTASDGEVSLSGPSSAPEWPMYRADPANTGGKSASIGPNQNISVFWEYEVEQEFATPAIANKTAYFGTRDGTLYALDLSTGEVQWTSETIADLSTVPAVSDGVIYLPSKQTLIYAFDASTGDTLWEFNPKILQGFYAPAVVENRLYTASSDGLVYAIDTDSGDRIWRNQYTQRGLSPPAVSNGIVITGGRYGRVVAVDGENGDMHWEFQSDRGPVSSYSAPVISDDTVIVSTDIGYVFGIDIESGEEKWWYNAEMGYGASIPPPSVSEEMVFIPAVDTIHSVSVSDGERIWTRDTIYSELATFDNDAIYVAARGGKVYALDKNSGENLWTKSVSDRLFNAPVMAWGVLLVRDYSTIYALGVNS